MVPAIRSTIARARTRTVALLLAGLIILAFVVGLMTYLRASDGTKQADAGAGLLATGVFGLLLLLFEQAISLQAREIRETVAVSAAPPPAMDESPPGIVRRPDRTQVNRYKVQYDGWQRDTSRVDASQVRLRLLNEDDSYFQFFTGIVPGIDTRLTLGSARNMSTAQFRRAVTGLAVELIREAIANGLTPLDDPTIAVEVFPNAEEAARHASQLEDREYGDGEIVAELVA
jgi:hypothetical protein